MVTEKIKGFSCIGESTPTFGGQIHHVAEYCHDKTGMIFMLIPHGCLVMGGRKMEIDPFLIGKYPVSRLDWKKVMETEGEGGGDDNRPIYVPWEEAQEFCQKTGLSLPTEAQWRYTFGMEYLLENVWEWCQDEWHYDDETKVGITCESLSGSYFTLHDPDLVAAVCGDHGKKGEGSSSRFGLWGFRLAAPIKQPRL